MFKTFKSLLLATFVILITACPISSVESQDSLSTDIAQTDLQQMGPYDIAVLPLEDVPEPSEDVYRPIFSSDAIRESAPSEILRVLKDPRHIPLDRFLYYKDPFESARNFFFSAGDYFYDIYNDRIDQSGKVITHPNAEQIISRFSNDDYSIIAVYLRTHGGIFEEEYTRDDETSYIRTVNFLDPFYVQDPVKDFTVEEFSVDTSEAFDRFMNFEWSPWSTLAVSDSESGLTLPCMPQQVLNPGDPYENPDTGDWIDPSSYLPPKPWYTSPTFQMEEDEVREGWVLCLAPDIPLASIELVRLNGYSSFMGLASAYDLKEIVWTTPDYKQMGDWHLLHNIEVVGWNDPASSDLFIPDTVSRNVVYQGDVWISIAASFFYEEHPDYSRSPSINTALQFYFDGLENLMNEWDHIALNKDLILGSCQDKNLEDCSSGLFSRDIFPITWLESSWDNLTITSYPFIYITYPGSDDYYFPPVGRTDPYRILAWHVEPQDASIPELTTHAICDLEEVDCLPEDLMFIYYENRNLDYGFVFDGPIPIIPFGESANGVRVLGYHFEETPVLDLGNPYGLDMRLDEADNVITDYQWLYVELEFQGNSNNMVVYHEVEDGIFNYFAGGEAIFFTNTGPFTAVDSGFAWITQFRSGTTKHGLFGEIVYNINPKQLILLITEHEGGGPAYALQ